MPQVVVALSAQRLAYHRVIDVMGCGAALGLSVPTAGRRAGGCGVARCAGGVVHDPVTGRGQGGEHLRAVGDFGGYVVVAAGGSGVHELPGVAGVEV